MSFRFFARTFLGLYFVFLSYLEVIAFNKKIDFLIPVLIFFILLFWNRKGLSRKLKSFHSIFFEISFLYLAFLRSISIIPNSIIPNYQYFQKVLVLSFFLYLAYLVIKLKRKFYVTSWIVFCVSFVLLFRYQVFQIEFLIFFLLSMNLDYLKKFTISKIIFLVGFLISLFASYGKFDIDNYQEGIFFLFEVSFADFFLRRTRNSNQLQHIQKFLLVPLSLYIISFFLIFLFISPEFQNKIFHFGITINQFHISNLSGNIVALAFLFYLFCKKDLYLFFLMLFCFVLITFTHSRISFFILISLSVVIVLQNFSKKNRPFLYLSLSLLTLAGFSFYSINPEVVKNFLSLFQRVDIWKVYLLIPNSINWFAGLGWNQEHIISFFPNYADVHLSSLVKAYVLQFESNPHAHNLYLQIYYSSGIIGIGLLGFYFVRSFLQSELRIQILVILLFFYALFDYLLIDPFFAIVFFLILLQRKTHSTSKVYANQNIFKIAMLFLILLSFILNANYHLKHTIFQKIHESNFFTVEYPSEFSTEAKQKEIYKSPFSRFPMVLTFKNNIYFGEYFLLQKDFVSAKSHFESCILKQPLLPVCYFGLSKSVSDPKEKEEFWEKGKRLDVFQRYKEPKFF